MSDELEWVDTAAGTVRARNNVRRFADAMASGHGKAEQYASWFLCPPSLKTWVAETGSVAGYETCRPRHFVRWLWIDIDRKDAEGHGDVKAALAAARTLVEGLEQSHKVSPRSLYYYFSGAKGFHILIPVAVFNPSPSPILNLAFKRMAVELAGATNVDERIYDLTRLCRIPGSQHGGSGLWKVGLRPSELLAWDVSQIIEVAAAGPRVEDLRDELADDYSESLHALWERCHAEAADELRVAAEKKASISTAIAVVPSAPLNFESLETLVDLLSPYWVEGGVGRHNLAFAITGYLAHNGIARDSAARVLERVMARQGDHDFKDRLKCVEDSYNKVEAGGAAAESVAGFSALRDLIGRPHELAQIERVVKMCAPRMIRPAPTGLPAPNAIPSLPSVSPTASSGDQIPAAPRYEDDPDAWLFPTYGEIPKQPVPPTIVRDLVPGASRGIVSGVPKGAKKTWWCLQLALSVSAGIPFMGHYEIERPGDAIYYSGEEPLFVLQDRVNKLAAGMSLDAARLPFRLQAPERPVRVRFDMRAHVDRLRRAVDHYHPVLLIFEPLAHLHQVDENKAGELVQNLLEPLTGLVLDTNVALLLAHHVGKGELTGGKAMRGSSALHGWYDTGYHAAPSSDNSYVRMSLEHRRLAQQPDLCFALRDGFCQDGRTPFIILERVERIKEPENPGRKKREKPAAAGAAHSLVTVPAAVDLAELLEIEKKVARWVDVGMGANVKQISERLTIPENKVATAVEHLKAQKILAPGGEHGRYLISGFGKAWLKSQGAPGAPAGDPPKVTQGTLTPTSEAVS